VYWELYDGEIEYDTNDIVQDIHSIDIVMDVGGWASMDYPQFQVSLYGRNYIDGPNMSFGGNGYIYRRLIHTLDGEWERVHIAKDLSSPDCRCLVLKVELIEETYTEPDGSEHVFAYADQYGDADKPPWGIRIHSASVWCTHWKRDVQLRNILETICLRGPLASSGGSSFVPNQCAFTELPKDAFEALEEVNMMQDMNFFCWDGETVEFEPHKAGTTWDISHNDPCVTLEYGEDLDEVYSAVWVNYTNAKGKLRGVPVYGTAPPGVKRRTDALDAPESIKTEKAARKLGERYLAAHTAHKEGTATIIGGGSIDPLLIRPGDIIFGEEVQHVTLKPLEWSATVQFGVNSKKFDAWLARLVAGKAKPRRR
jgi:hypothetical protein